jgi:hypothetical protein
LGKHNTKKDGDCDVEKEVTATEENIDQFAEIDGVVGQSTVYFIVLYCLPP